MKTLLTTVVILIVSITVKAQIPYDKKLHFAGGVLVAESASILNEHTLKANDFAVRLSASIIAGIGKEIIDSKQVGNRFDKVDAIATICGGAASKLTHYVLPKKLAMAVNIGVSGAYLVHFKIKF